MHATTLGIRTGECGPANVPAKHSKCAITVCYGCVGVRQSKTNTKPAYRRMYLASVWMPPRDPETSPAKNWIPRGSRFLSSQWGSARLKDSKHDQLENERRDSSSRAVPVPVATTPRYKLLLQLRGREAAAVSHASRQNPGSRAPQPPGDYTQVRTRRHGTQAKG